VGSTDMRGQNKKKTTGRGGGHYQKRSECAPKRSNKRIPCVWEMWEVKTVIPCTEKKDKRAH